MSLLTVQGSMSWRMKVSVDFFSDGPQNPDMICISGLLVMRNLTPGIPDTNCHRYDFLVRLSERTLLFSNFLNFILHFGLITTPYVLMLK